MGSVEEKKAFPMTCSPKMVSVGDVFHFTRGGVRFPIRVVRRITVLEARDNDPSGYTQLCQMGEVQYTGLPLYWYELSMEDILAIMEKEKPEESNGTDHLVS